MPEKMQQRENKKFLEDWYKTDDPWGYEKHPHDRIRKSKILDCLRHRYFSRVLDIGCGQGFITRDLPGKQVFGYDLSETALKRLPGGVFPLKMEDIKGKYDLIIATGIIYEQYDYKWIVDTINKHASDVVLTCNITDWEMPYINKLKNQIHVEEFPYRDWIERIRIYDYSKNHNRNYRPGHGGRHNAQILREARLSDCQI